MMMYICFRCCRGIDLPYPCCAGTGSTCSGKVTGGDIDQSK